MKALVTGGAGLIGSHIVDLLLEKGYDVRIFDNLEKETHPFGKPKWIPGKAEFIKGEMQDKKAVEEALQGIDIVFHEAAYGGFSPDANKFVYSNVVGTTNIFEAIREKKLPIKKIVLASSQAVYGEGKYECKNHKIQFPNVRQLEQLLKGEWEVKCPICGAEMKPLPTDENVPVDPGIMYSISKYAEERISLKLGQTLNIPTVALRYSVTYGPRQSLFNPYTGICSIFSTRLLNDLPIVVYEDGNQKRDFIFVKDVARANLFVMESKKADYNVFNVGTGKPTSVLEFISILSDTYHKKAKIEMNNAFRPGEVRHLYSDASKLASIGFKPGTTVREGIAEYVEWIKTQGKVKEYFSEAFETLKKRGVVMNAKAEK